MRADLTAHDVLDALQDALGMSDDAEAKMQFLFALRSKGVTDKRVLTAMEKIDRGVFVRGIFADRAYEDMPLPIACGQTISQPSVVGLMTQALEVSPRDKVLEVGTGSGYQAAILSQLARRVYTVDRHRRLVRAARGVFEALGLTNITAFTADGSRGLPEQAPFDRILVTAAAEDPPGPALGAAARSAVSWCCRSGSPTRVQSLIRVTRREDGFDYDELRPVRFVPLVEGLGQGLDRVEGPSPDDDGATDRTRGARPTRHRRQRR